MPPECGKGKMPLRWQSCGCAPTGPLSATSRSRSSHSADAGVRRRSASRHSAFKISYGSLPVVDKMTPPRSRERWNARFWPLADMCFCTVHSAFRTKAFLRHIETFNGSTTCYLARLSRFYLATILTHPSTSIVAWDLRVLRPRLLISSRPTEYYRMKMGCYI